MITDAGDNVVDHTKQRQETYGGAPLLFSMVQQAKN